MAEVLALTGYMGSGKSSVGRMAAERVGWRFVDLDAEVERALRASIAGYFADHGEKAFRERESETLAAVLAGAEGEDLVLALGGGTVLSSENLAMLDRVARVLLLDVDADEAWDRVQGSDRPLAQDRGSFAELLASRRAVYEEAADWVLPTAGSTVERVVDRLASLMTSEWSNSHKLWGRWLLGAARGSLIIGGDGALEVLGAHASSARAAGRSIRVITDAHVMDAWGERVSALLGGVPTADVMVLEPGESSKSVRWLNDCWEWLSSRNTLRGDVVVALGGGVVGDLAGFVAATYHRGIGLWQVPTSLLAQIDSSVGGKTAINLSSTKNQVGAFYQADLVIIDPSTLSTLPQTELIGALGEAVKHALLSGEQALSALERDQMDIVGRDLTVLSRLVKRNVWLKASVVQADEMEAAGRAILNLGHTTAHALESALGYGSLSHGQAVALGVLVALRVSERLLSLDPMVRTRTERLLTALGLETKVALPPMDAINEAAGRDKKIKAGASGFVGLRAVGSPVWGLQVSPEMLSECLEVIRRWRRATKRLILLHGANLDMLGERDPDHYGTVSLQRLEDMVRAEAARRGWRCICLQTNHEGSYIEMLHRYRDATAMIVNPGAWTHYSYAIRDAVELVRCPVAEVHLSDIGSRQEWRRNSVLSEVVAFTVSGKGAAGYIEAVARLAELLENDRS